MKVGQKFVAISDTLCTKKGEKVRVKHVDEYWGILIKNEWFEPEEAEEKFELLGEDND